MTQSAGLLEEIQRVQGRYRELRRHIHANPELGFEEVATAELVASHLAELGIDVARGLATTGVVGTLSRGTSKRSIGLRADMDALPIHEENTFAHRSRRDGCFHGCGHDGHVVMLLAAAEYLASSCDFDGTVHLIFQPAEEGLGGGKAMIEEGLFESFPCDAVYGMHNWPLLEVGRFATRPGAFLACSDIFDIVIAGQGGHAAFPELANNPIKAGSVMVAELQDIDRVLGGNDQAALLTVTQFHGGDAYNVIPRTVSIHGGVRSFDVDRQQLAETEMRQRAEDLATRMDVAIDVSYRRIYPVLINTEPESLTATRAAAAVVGADNVDGRHGPIKGSEDFAFMLEERPGCYILIGGGQREASPMCHDSTYDFNDDIIP
ncbi:MAG: amidohydrolase, partial [Gammaproteobacteria bacterium]